MDVQDHDQRLKTLLKQFLRQFFELFWPEHAKLFDFDHVTWLENEAFPDPPQGRRRVLDLVARLPLKEPVRDEDGTPVEDLVAIIHVEIESADRAKPLRKTTFQYFSHLRQKYDEPILPVAVNMRVGQDGIGTASYLERFGDLEIVRYNYPYVGLPALEGERFLNQENSVGVALAALMKVPPDRRVAFKAEALARSLRAPENEYHRFLLAEFIQAYLPLNEIEQQEFDRLLTTNEFQEVREMATTWFEQGLEQGLDRGIKEGQRALAATLLERRFGPLSSKLRSLIDEWPDAQLGDLIEMAYRVESADDLPPSPGGKQA